MNVRKMFGAVFVVVVILPVITISLLAASPDSPSELKVNNLVNPLGIDTSNPRFSWIVNDTDRGESQTAYQIIVASSLANINNNSGDKWDSGKVMSGVQGDVIYSGSALASRSNYWAMVRTWDKDGNISPWSPAATFETAFLNSSTEWTAKMIGGDYWRCRKQFALASKAIARARAYISGKDEFVLRINGSKIGNSVVNSDASYYDLRKWYFTYDVTGNLTSGTSNTVAVFVGAGRFGFENRWGTYADRGFTLQLEVIYTDGTRDLISSDGTWKCTKTGPFINTELNNLYDGEKYDARNEDAWDSNGFDDSSWSAAIEVTNTATMTARYMEPMLVTQTITPVSVTQTPSGTYVFDMGQNISGYAQLTVSGPAGTTNIMKFGELLTSSGSVDQSNLKVFGGAQATDWYVCKGGGTEVWEPMFTLHGYQYVELSGFPGIPTVNSLKGRVVHQAVDIDDSTKGSFSCSDALLNKIHSCFIWGIRNNMSAGMPTDCCQRDERMGWLGDAMLETEGVSYNYQVENFFSQWMNSVDDCQSPGGYVDSAGPTQGIFGDNLASGGDVPWTSASVIIPYKWYMAYGNTSSLQQIYGKMKRYLDWLQATQNADHTQSRDQWGDHGDWRTDTGLLATAFYFKAADTLSKIAAELGNTVDASTYSTLAGTIKNAFNAKYLIGNSYYTGNYPTANAIPLAFNLVPDSARTNVLTSLVNQLRTDGFTMHAGILGTFCMFEALCENGRSDIAYLLATQNTGQSWGSWIMNMNATTMFEFWDGSKSRDHAYYGGPIDSYFYKYLAGISPATAGYKTIKIKPTISANLTNVNATVNTYRGPVSCSWSTSGKTISMNVTIPVNSQAEVYVPACGCGTSRIFITEGGTKIWSSGAYIAGVAEISFNRTDGDYVVFNVGSGNYGFSMTGDGSFSSPGGPAGYTWCSADGGTYTLSGICDVAYGANGFFHYLHSKTGPVTFNSATFGDPIVGTEKTGYFKNADPSGPAGYTWCAYETGSFTLSGACDVAFGANGAYNYRYNQTGTIKFDVNTFGDPIVGVSKLGFFKVSTIILSTTNQTGSGIGTFIPNWGAVTNGSLIAGQLPSSATGDFNLEPYFGTRSVNSLTAGENLAISEGGSPATTSANYVTCGNGGSPAAGSSVIYTLAGSANGYDLTNIVVYGGWGDYGRDQQAYTVYYSTVAAPANFIPLMPVNFNPSIAAGLQSATRVSLTYPGGVLAANVAAVKFDFTSPGSESGYCGYSQITVFGIPSTNAISIPIITTTNQTGSGSGPFYPGWTVITNGSLIAGHAPDSASGNFSEEVPARNVNSLTAGGDLGITLIQGTLAGTASTNYVTCGNGYGAGSSVTYVLTGSATGYDLTNLTIYGGWVNNGRDQQAYTVYYSTAAAPTTFFYLAQVNYNPAVAASLLDATRVTLTSSVGVLASNVAAVKFDFTNPGSENGYCGYAGITVFGSASILPAVPANLSATVQAAQTGFIINAGSLVVGRNYTLQSTTNLAAATWAAENNFVATQTTTAWTNSNSNNPQKFYRLAGY